MGVAHTSAVNHFNCFYLSILMLLKLNDFALILIILTSVFNLVVRIWRLNIIALILQYLGIFIIIGSMWPIELAIIKLLVGWMVSTVLGITLFSLKSKNSAKERIDVPGQIFRGITGLLIVIFVNYLTPSIKAVLSANSMEANIFSGLILLGIGLFQMGLTSDLLYIIIGLLTFISGFEVLYAVVEMSTLLSGLLAGINLGLILVGSWLLSKVHEGEIV